MHNKKYDCERVSPVLRTLIDSDFGRPLDGETRDFMEARFGRNFGGVRLHTNAESAEVLGAKAFTIGEHLVFDEGQYAPQTPAGRRLLAHELTHFVQQDGRRPRDPRAWHVGAADDLFEDEAERVAQQVMSGGALPAITPDHGGIIRRVVRPDVSSTKINIDIPNDVQMPRAPSGIAGHATDADFISGVVDVQGNPQFGQECINADASVMVHGAAGDSLAGWTFGFMQVQGIETNWGDYRGEKDPEGSMTLQRGRPPARRIQVCRDATKTGRKVDFFFDSKSVTAPFPSGPAAFPMAIEVNNWADTPGEFYRLRERNSKTGNVNFLHEVQVELPFLTVFAARDPAGAFTFLAHFFWNVHWQARFRPASFADLAQPWNVQLVPGGNAKNVGPVLLGDPQPANARERAMLAALTDPDLENNCNNLRDAAADQPTSTIKYNLGVEGRRMIETTSSPPSPSSLILDSFGNAG
jgi:hypothetical protein